ncbi:MAG: sensor histidine kinase [Chlamydiales bacterium]|nr:sensor histidine kinase [Chlamydiales bacterium]
MKIFAKLLISFLVIALVPLVLVTVFASSRWEKIAKQEQLISLSEILKSRMEYIAEYFTNMTKQATMMGRTENVTNVIINRSLINNKALDNDLHLFANLFELSDVYIIDRDGSIIYSLNHNADYGTNLGSGPYKDTQLAKVFQDVNASYDTTISEFDIYPVSGKPEIFIGAPIFEGDEYLGVFAFEIPPSEVYKIFQDYTSLKDTGEVLIAKLEGDHLLFVNPIRHKLDAAFQFRIPVGAQVALPMQEAVQRISGKGQSVDYRDEQVLAVWSYFPMLKWGIVIKIDLAEALAPIKYFTNLLLLIGGITILIVILVVIVLARLFAGPIGKLERAFKDVGQGNLDVQVDIRSKDEVGALAQSFMRMVGELKASTTSINRLNQEVEERKKSEQAKTELISRVSHELRTPMTPIKSGLEILLSTQENLTAQQKELLGIINENSSRLLELINEMLMSEQMDEGKATFKFAQCDIGSLVHKTIDARLDSANKKGLSVERHVDQGLPLIFCDEDKIENVMLNLLDNAIKYTEKGQIEITCKQVDDKIEIAVKDTGVGISKEDQEKLFQKFRELQTRTSQKSQGFGVRLAIGSKVVEAHGGKLWVSSQPGQGSTFYIALPIKKKEA